MKILNLRLIKTIFDILNKIRFRSLYIYIYLFLSCSKGNFLFRLFNSIFLFNLIHFERMWSSKNFGKNMALNQPLLLSVHSTRALNVSLQRRETKISLANRAIIILRKLFTSKKRETIPAIPFHNFFHPI